MYKVGLVGYGAFGKLLEHQLKPYCEIAVHDVSLPDTLPGVLAQPIIILALPVQALEDFLSTNKDLLNPKALYVDVCSVKVKPVATMLKHLPPTASVIASHPLFGPASARDGLHEQRIMIYPVRVSDETYERFKLFLNQLGLQIIETTPEEHDRSMAYVQGISHYIGRIMQTMQIPETQLATRAYKDLLDMKNVQGKDSDELFAAISKLNPYSSEIFASFESAREQVNKQFEL